MVEDEIIATLAMRITLEKTILNGKHTKKAFTNVEQLKMFEILKSPGIKCNSRKMMLNLYKNQTAMIEV